MADLTKNDLPFLMREFYRKAMNDPLIGPKFTGLDMEAHLPRIIDFWSSVIFFDTGYSGRPFDKHVPLNLNKDHFDRWLSIFETTVEGSFQGEKADLIISKANQIALFFRHKIEHLNTLQ